MSAPLQPVRGRLRSPSVSSRTRSRLADSLSPDPPGACTDGDPSQALGATFRAEQGALLRYFRRHVGHEAAHDLLQDVFTRAAGSAQAARLINPAAFLQRIARNLLIDRARRQARDANLVVRLDDQMDAVAQPEQERTIEAADLKRSYDAAVAGLPEKTQRVFLMSRDQELTYAEIGERLGISSATVQYHMVRAIAEVTAQLKAQS